ncbi:hypothetical protein [Nocardia abscessus]|uniref:hypothetical protein n=1 Tax=Nocardia abscessus TaxID=120957 RepID=UPI0024545C02|nr:hypothetical protein [Nocardia abscessus]
MLERLHDVQLTPFDLGGRQNAVDYVFTSDRGAGAVEMTTIRDGQAAAWQSRLALHEDQLIRCASTRAWMLSIDLTTQRKTLQARIPPVIELLDGRNLDSLSQLPIEEWTEDVRWLAQSQNNLQPSSYGDSGTVRLWLPAQARIVDDGQIDADLAREFSTPLMQGKAEKLRKHSDVVERHLAIGVAMYGPGFTLLDQLMFSPGHPPRWDPQPVLAGVTHIWLTCGTRDVLAWDVLAGWSWRRLFALTEEDEEV